MCVGVGVRVCVYMFGMCVCMFCMFLSMLVTGVNTAVSSFLKGKQSFILKHS